MAWLPSSPTQCAYIWVCLAERTRCEKLNRRCKLLCISERILIIFFRGSDSMGAGAGAGQVSAARFAEVHVGENLSGALETSNCSVSKLKLLDSKSSLQALHFKVSKMSEVQSGDSNKFRRATKPPTAQVFTFFTTACLTNAPCSLNFLFVSAT